MTDETPPRDARLSLRTIAMPADTNPSGDIFGGWLMAQMDLAGGTHAIHRAQGRVATVAVEGMTFHKPVYVGDEVTCHTRITRAGNTSVSVLVEVWVERCRGSRVEKVTEGTYTFVALDEHGHKRPIPPTGDEQ